MLDDSSFSLDSRVVFDGVSHEFVSALKAYAEDNRSCNGLGMRTKESPRSCDGLNKDMDMGHEMGLVLLMQPNLLKNFKLNLGLI